MTFKSNILILTCVPIIIIFLSAIASQFASLVYTKSYIETFANSLFDSQIMFSKQFSHSISLQLNNQLQKLPIYIRSLNNVYSKILIGQITLNDNHIPTFVSMEAMYVQEEDTQLMNMFRINPYSVTSWYHKNYTKIIDLNRVGQDLMRNFTGMTPLMRAMDYENGQNQQMRQLQFKDMFFGHDFQGIMISKSVNTTHANMIPIAECGNGKYNFDPRCRQWYKQAAISDSLTVLKPDFIYSDVYPKLASSSCQKLLQYNSQLDQDLIHHVGCINFPISNLQEYFKNFVKSTKQTYMIEPLSQIIVFDSKNLQSGTTISNLQDVEFENLELQEEAIKFNKTLHENYNSWIYKSYQRSDEIGFSSLSQQQVIFPYVRNGTKYQVILNPIFLIDKLPQFQGIKKTSQTRGFSACLIYLQIIMLSDEEMREFQNKILNNFKSLGIGVSTALLVQSIITIFVASYYSVKISNLLNAPINHLILVLNKISQEEESEELIQIFNDSQKAEEIFLSQETRELYESFVSVFQMLLYTSENFFQENETQTLLKLHKNIEFFKQFQNIYAVGITHNNIGSIFVSQGYYFQALEHFSSSLMYAKYEIQQYCKENPDQISLQIISQHSYHDYYYESQFQNRNTSLFKTDSKIGKSTNQDNFKSRQSYNKNISIYNSKQSQSKLNDLPKDKLNNLSLVNVNSYNKPKSMNQIYSRQDLSSKNIINEEESSNCIIEKLEIKNLPAASKNLHLISKQTNEDEELTPQIKYNLDSYSGKDLLSEQALQLLSSLYYRKKNYIIALIAFQETVDLEIQHNKANNSHLSNKSPLTDQFHLQDNIMYNDTNFEEYKNEQENVSFKYNANLSKNKNLYYNFWFEIIDLLKELLIISYDLPFEEPQKVDILSQIAKCQFKLNNFERAEKILNNCKSILKNTQNNNKNKTNSRNIKWNEDLEQQQDQKKFQEKRLNSNKIQPNRNQMISKQILSTTPTAIKDFQTAFTMSATAKDAQVTLMRSTTKSSVRSAQQQQQLLNFISDEAHRTQQQTSPMIKIESSESLSQFRFLTPLKNNKNVNCKPKLPFNEIPNVIDLQRKASSMEIASKLLSKEDLSTTHKQDFRESFQVQEEESNMNILNQKKIDMEDITFNDDQEQSRYKHPSIVTNPINKPIIKYNQNKIFNQNVIINYNTNTSSTQSNLQIPHKKEINTNKKQLNEKQQNQNQSNEKSLNEINKYLEKEDNFIKKIQIFRKNSKLVKYDNEVKQKIETEQESKRRKTEKAFENRKLFLVSCPSFEYLRFIIDFTWAELLMEKKDNVQAGFILTSLLENNKSFMSHYPQRIIHQLSRIFNKLNVFSSELSQFRTKFNPNLSFKIAIVCASQTQPAYHYRQLFLLHNLFHTILTQTNDQLAIIYINKDHSSLCPYLPLTQVSKISTLSRLIIEDINQSTSLSQIVLAQTCSLLQEYSAELKQRQQLYLKSHQISTLRLQYTNDIDEFEDNLDQQSDKINVSSQEDDNTNTQQDYQFLKILKPQFPSFIYDNSRKIAHIHLIQEENEQSKIEPQILSPDMLESDDQDDNKGDNYDNDSRQINKIQTQNNLTFFSINNPKDQTTNMDMLLGDLSVEQSSISKREEIVQISECLAMGNKLFHKCIRETLVQFFQSNINFTRVEYNIQQQKLKQQMKAQQCQYNNDWYMSAQQGQNNPLLIKDCKKFIIYNSEKVEIINDNKFQQLCDLLLALNIQILMHTQQKGNNFIEILANQTLQYKNKEIIKVFYSRNKTVNFLKSQRDNIYKYTYPINIQHF